MPAVDLPGLEVLAEKEGKKGEKRERDDEWAGLF